MRRAFVLALCTTACANADGPTTAPSSTVAQSTTNNTSAPVQPSSGPSESLTKPTKFKVTSADPPEVEAALAAGWSLVNCSVGAGVAAPQRRSIVVEHCYFVGAESELKTTPTSSPSAATTTPSATSTTATRAVPKTGAPRQSKIARLPCPDNSTPLCSRYSCTCDDGTQLSPPPGCEGAVLGHGEAGHAVWDCAVTQGDAMIGGPEEEP